MSINPELPLEATNTYRELILLNLCPEMGEQVFVLNIKIKLVELESSSLPVLVPLGCLQLYQRFGRMQVLFGPDFLRKLGMSIPSGWFCIFDLLLKVHIKKH